MNALVEALTRAVPGSSCRLLGSLATGTADAYSDIDLEWRLGRDAPMAPTSHDLSDTPTKSVIPWLVGEIGA